MMTSRIIEKYKVICLDGNEHLMLFELYIYIYIFFFFFFKALLVWVSGLSAGLQTEGLPVRFSVREHAWVSGQVPSWGRVRANRSLNLLYISVSLPLFLPPFPSL